MVTVASPKDKRGRTLYTNCFVGPKLIRNAHKYFLSTQTHLQAFHVCRLCAAALQWASLHFWSDQPPAHSYPASVCLWEKTGSVSIIWHDQCKYNEMVVACERLATTLPECSKVCEPLVSLPEISKQYFSLIEHICILTVLWCWSDEIFQVNVLFWLLFLFNIYI